MKLSIEFEVERRLGDPMLRILIDDYITLYDGVALDQYTFDISIPNGSHDLKIVHYGKMPEHHTIDTNGSIVIDRHVQIKHIVLDDIALEQELWTGQFFPVYMHKAEHEPYFIAPNLYLGHNGTWKLEFGVPAAKWLIDLRKQGPNLSDTIFKSDSDTLAQAKNFFKDLPDV